MNDTTGRAAGDTNAFPPIHVDDNSIANAGLNAGSVPNGGVQPRSRLEQAKELLARVIRQSGQNPDAAFTRESLKAAALLEEHDLATFARYRRNLRERHISIAMLDTALRRLKSARRSPAHMRTAAATNSTTSHRTQGRALKLPEPQPWPTSLNGASLLNELSTTIRSYTVLAPEAADAVALWVVFTYLLDVFENSPRLAITSPQKRCGKTTLLSLLYRLSCRPLAAANLSPAVAFRVIEAVKPTLLIDETDTFLNHHDELRGILNSGHTRATGFILRCEGKEPRCFSTWCAIALAGIGKLPATLADRSIEIRLKRKTHREPTRRLDRHASGLLEPLACKSARWALDQTTKLHNADPEVPAALDDRAADNWRPLLAVADVAGGIWPRRARMAALALSANRDDYGPEIALLAAIRDLFAARQTRRLSSKCLVDALISDPTGRWCEFNRGKPLTEAQVATLLRPFEIYPADFGGTRYYRFVDCQDAFGRYLFPKSRRIMRYQLLYNDG